MPKTSQRFPDSDVLAAAILSAQGCNQKAIAARLGTSQSNVAKLLNQATARGWYRPYPSVIYGNVPPEVLVAANHKLSGARCESAVSRLAPSGHVCRVWTIHERSPRTFSTAAADAVITHVLEARVLGVAWGRAVAAVVEGLEASLPEPARGASTNRKPVGPVPVCGEPLRVATTLHEYSSSLLAMRIGRALNGKSSPTPIPSLAGVPAYIPGKLGEAARQTVRTFFAEVTDYAAVVGENGLLAKMDTLLTGIGVPDSSPSQPPHGVFVSERAVSEGLTGADMMRLVYGDIAGVLIPRRGLSPADTKLVASLNDGWTGIRMTDIARCAREANDAGRGGVIVVSHHGHKRDLVRELVRLGLVNHLVIDEPLDDELCA